MKTYRPAPSFTCPDCGRTSYHPEDVRHQYCGNCHKFTGIISPDEAHKLRRGC